MSLSLAMPGARRLSSSSIMIADFLRRFLTAAVLLPTVVFADPVEEAISDIRAKYNRIEGWQMAPQRITFESQVDPASGELKKYYYDGQLAKANLIFAEGDHGGGDETYYYHGGELFFAYVVQSYWKFTGRTLANGESETVDVMSEHRLYFSGGNLIRHLRKEVQSTNPEALRGLLANAPNQPYSDPGFASDVQRRGIRCSSVSSPAGLEQVVVGP